MTFSSKYPGDIWALLLAALMFVLLDGSILAVNYSVSNQVKSDSLAINLIGRQRMLSQRITKSLFALGAEQGSPAASSHWTELASSTALFDETLHAFARGGRITGPTGATIPVLAIADPQGQHLLRDAERLWAAPHARLKFLLDRRGSANATDLADATAAMAGSNLRLLDCMNRLTSRVQTLSEERTVRLRLFQLIAFVLALANFAFIIHRLVARTGRTLLELRASNQKLGEQDERLTHANMQLAQIRGDLESRVIERTRELHAANDGLRSEMALRREAEQRLRIYAEVVNGTSEGVVIADIDHTVIDVNAGYQAITGRSKIELLGTRLLENATEPVTTEPLPGWRESLAGRHNWRGELLLSRKDGSSVPCLAYVNEVHEEHGGRPRYLACICHDISDLRQHQAMLQHQATHDALTGLPNRVLLLDRLGRSINRAVRGKHRLAVLFIDLDKFKNINDTFGHSAGDELLVAVSQRLAGCVREYDTFARLGGDEFVILADHVDDEHDVSRLAERVVSALTAPIPLSEAEQAITCSIGISTFPDDGNNPESLMKNADIALYRAKQGGRNNFQFFKAEMQTRLSERMSMESRLRHAIENDEFLLHFQPQVDLRSGGIVGLEALVRWQSPELGLVPPARFIPLAEESSLIHGIGEWVLNRACASIAVWQRLNLAAVPVAINVSASQFATQDLVGITERALRNSGIDARFLELELTESLAMIDPDASLNLMRRLKQLGVSLSIDDFGTGYSNLGYLKRFPIDRLKLDQSFVRGLTSGTEDRAISTAVIGLAHALGLRAIAEGVETEGQMKLLAMLGCDEIQGYYFRKPMPESEVTDLLARGDSLDLRKITRSPYRRTVLLVDDDPNELMSVKRQLRNEPITLLTAESAEQAYELLAHHEVGVVVSDYKMPAEDGIEFLARVKQMYPLIVRVMLSGHSSTDLFTTAINKGEVFRFETKPWKETELLDTLRQAFGRFERDEFGIIPFPEARSRSGR